MCSVVGVGGLALNGGLSLLSRAYGATADNILEATLALADGSVVSWHPVCGHALARVQCSMRLGEWWAGYGRLRWRQLSLWPGVRQDTGHGSRGHGGTTGCCMARRRRMPLVQPASCCCLQVHATPESDAELLWALKGAGGQLGWGGNAGARLYAG